MPFYEYRCNKCGHQMTIMQSMSAEPLKTCPQCHEDGLEKLISASGFDLKGIGVFGNSKQPFKNDTCSAASNACSSCPHASKSK